MSKFEVKKTNDPVNPWVILEGEKVAGRFPEERLARDNARLMEGNKENEPAK